MRKGILDADGLIYAIAAVTERDDFDDGNWEADLPAAIAVLELQLEAIEKVVGPFEIYVGFKSDKNFRYEIASTYKGNRVGKRRPEGLELLKKHVVKKMNGIKCVGVEVDDVVCSLKLKEPKRFLIAVDKDVVGQCPGIHYNFKKKEFIHTSVKEAKFFKYWQAIIGDSGDGYPGVPGIGPVKAADFINPDMTDLELQAGVIAAFESKKWTIDHALIQMRLADMHQYDSDTKKITLFTFDKSLDTIQHSKELK